MIYIYDILLNFEDSKRLLEFYEWDKKDSLTHIKKIPLFKISSEDLSNIINSKIKIEKSFLDKIDNKTIIYKNKKNIKYACLFCNMEKVVAVEFYKDGSSICKSSLLLDEEEDICNETRLFDDYKIKYEIIEKNKDNLYLTRKEEIKQRYLLTEINNLYKDKELDKFNYLYEEVFNKDNLNINKKYNKLLNDIKTNYNEKYNKLYEIVRLSYQKK